LNGLRPWRSWPLATTVIAAAAVAAYQLFFFAAVARTGVAVGTIVGIGSTPVAAGILVLIVYHHWPGRRWLLATILAIVGCALLILNSGDIKTDVVGIFLAIAAGASYALYTMLTKDLLQIHPVGAVLTVTFSLGVIFLLPVLFWGDLSWLLQPRGMAVALHLGIVTVGFAYLLYAIGLATVSVANAATLTLGEPLTAGLLGVFILGEQLTRASIAGIALLLAGLLLIALQRNQTEEPGLEPLSEPEGQLPHP
jgi:DME family drug/metabolite transporter